MEASQPLTISGSLEFGVPIDSTNSVFALLHSWFLPSSPANSSHLLRDKRFGAALTGLRSYHGAIAGCHGGEQSQGSSVAGPHLRPPASGEPAATTAPGAMGSVLGRATIPPGQSSYAVSMAEPGAAAELAPVEAAAGAQIPEPSSSGPQEPSFSLRRVAAPATPDQGNRAPPAGPLRQPRDPRRLHPTHQLAASLGAAGELQATSQAGNGNNSSYSSSGDDINGSSGGCSGGRSNKGRSGAVGSGHRNKNGGSSSGSGANAVGEGIPAATPPEGAPPPPCDEMSSPAAVAFVHRSAPSLPSSYAAASALGPGFWQEVYGCKVAGVGAEDGQSRSDSGARPQAPLHTSSTGGSCRTPSPPATLSGQGMADGSKSGTGGACGSSGGGTVAGAPTRSANANVSTSGSAAAPTAPSCGGVSSTAGWASGGAAGRSEWGSGPSLPLGADGRTRSQPGAVLPPGCQPRMHQQQRQRQVPQQDAWLQQREQQQPLRWQLEDLRAEYAQLARINERLRGTHSAEVARQEGVAQRQEAALAALREQCVVLQHRTQTVLARMQQQQQGGGRMPGAHAAAAEAEAEAGIETAGPSAQLGGSQAGKPAAGCAVCASWQVVLERVVGSAPSEGGHPGVRVCEAGTALLRGGCGGGGGTRVSAGGAPQRRGQHGLCEAVAAAGTATPPDRVRPCVHTPQRPRPGKEEGESLSSRTSPGAGGSYRSPPRTPIRGATLVTALQGTPPSTAAMRPLTPMLGVGVVAGGAALGSGC